MKRKDCEFGTDAGAAAVVIRPMFAALIAVSTVGLSASDLTAGSVRLWRSAVVVDESVRLSDLCELKAFDRATHKQLSEMVVTNAPPLGGSRVIHMDLVRSALAAAGTNMAEVTLSGATKCDVTRPGNIVRPGDTSEGSASAGKP